MATNESWIKSHFENAASELETLFLDSGFQLKNKRILDIGAGDGLIAAGLVTKSGCNVTGIDLIETNKSKLIEALPRKYRKLLDSQLDFVKVDRANWGFADNVFDGIYSWSAAEHFEDSVGIYSEARRVLSPSGIFVLQTYPLWNSRWGHHLDTWVPEFFHLTKSEEEIENSLKNIIRSRVSVELSNGKKSFEVNEILSDRELSRDDWVQNCMRTFRSTNKIDASAIFQALHSSGFEIRRLEVISLPTLLPSNLNALDTLNYGIEGLKLVCVPRN